MILEIEYYRYVTQLVGKPIGFKELQQQLNKTELLYDVKCDNFIELFCRTYNRAVIDTNEIPDYIYDRDTKQLYKPKL